MDGGAWWAAVHGVAKSRTGLSNFTFTFHFHALEREMATHSSVLAWRIPGTEEPGGLPIYGVTQSRTRLKWLSSSSSKALRWFFKKICYKCCRNFSKILLAFCYCLSYFSYLKILRMYILMSPNCEKTFCWHELERKKAETSLCWQNLYSQSYGFCSSHLGWVGP